MIYLIIFILLFLSCYSKEYLLPVGTFKMGTMLYHDWLNDYEYIYKKKLENGYKLKIVDKEQVMEYGIIIVKERRIK